MADAGRQESNTSLHSDVSSSELMGLNNLSETLTISRPSSTTSELWETDIDILFNRMLYKIKTKKEELKKKEESLETVGKSLEEEYKTKIKSLDSKAEEIETRKKAMESELSKKIQVSKILSTRTG